MLKESVSISDVCDLLNEMLEKDYDCVYALVNDRARCNRAIADHPTIQVRYENDDYPSVGLLGFLNGLFGIRDDYMGAICMDIEDDKIIRFMPTPES